MAPALEAPRRWRAQKCPRPHSSPRVPTARRKVRLEPVLPCVAALSSGGRPCPGRAERGLPGSGMDSVKGLGAGALGAPQAPQTPTVTWGSLPHPGHVPCSEHALPLQWAPWIVSSAETPSSAPTSWTHSFPTSTQGPRGLALAVSVGWAQPGGRAGPRRLAWRVPKCGWPLQGNRAASGGAGASWPQSWRPRP